VWYIEIGGDVLLDAIVELQSDIGFSAVLQTMHWLCVSVIVSADSVNSWQAGEYSTGDMACLVQNSSTVGKDAYLTVVHRSVTALLMFLKFLNDNVVSKQLWVGGVLNRVKWCEMKCWICQRYIKKGGKGVCMWWFCMNWYHSSYSNDNKEFRKFVA
jgi:hypothetical protein